MIKGIGVDIIEIERVKTAVDKYGDSFLQKVYTEKELKYCRSRKNLRYPELAVRFAAKEAYSKAVGTGIKAHGWKAIEVRNDARGKPFIAVNGKTAKKAHVSLSHSRDYAVAVVCLEA